MIGKDGRNGQVWEPCALPRAAAAFGGFRGDQWKATTGTSLSAAEPRGVGIVGSALSSTSVIIC